MLSKPSPILSKKHSENDLFFNAFMDTDSEPRPSSTSTSIMTSEGTPRKRRPTIKRSGSDDTPSSSGPSVYPLAHSRSHSNHDEYSHPLRSAALGSGYVAGDDWGVTRPHLSRMLSSWESPAGSDMEVQSDVGSSVGGTRAIEEKTVLVHEVLSTDSLAGVALKYGIKIAELRKANQLWTSDSIHLRKVLYIPLHDAPFDGNGGQPPSNELAGPTISLDPSYDGKPHTSTIRRIPASQLSFFPPAAKTHLNSPIDGVNYKLNSPPISIKRSGSSTLSAAGSPHSRALSSILTAFPIAPSTRDTIIARLSFDSERTSASDEQELELNEVQTSAHTVRPRPHIRPSTSHSDLHHCELHHDIHSSIPLSPPNVTSRSISPTTPLGHRKSWSHSDSLDPLHVTVRTVQLEPSPVMRVPSLTLKQQSRSRDPTGRQVDEHGTRW